MNSKKPILNPLRMLNRLLSDLAVYSALYAICGIAAAFELLSIDLPWLVLLAAGLSTVGVYLVDRIKLRDADLDPADLASMPRRHEYLRAHSRVFRATALGCLGISVLLFWAQRWWLGPLPAFGAASVLLYTRGSGHGTRLKDRLLLKNAVVGAAVVVLAGSILLSIGSDLAAAESSVALGWLGLVVFADAALSDLDDRFSDARFGTRTLPNTIGVPRTWGVALLIQVIAGSGLIWVFGVTGETLLLGAAFPATTAMLWWIGPKQIRDSVDLRLPILVFVVLILV